VTASKYGRRNRDPEDGTGKEIPLVAPKKGKPRQSITKGVEIIGGGPQPAKEGVSVLHKP
jgi:hypothetical protein